MADGSTGPSPEERGVPVQKPEINKEVGQKPFLPSNKPAQEIAKPKQAANEADSRKTVEIRKIIQNESAGEKEGASAIAQQTVPQWLPDKALERKILA